MPEDLAEYRALLDKVGELARVIEARRTDDIACARGCDQCCHVQLEVLPVEAASISAHLEAMEPERRETIRRRAGVHGERCPMLAPDGACDVYEARPIICRTQGHALSYPPDVIPAEAVRARAGGEVTWCPLNYGDAPPAGADVLNVEHLDRLLFLVNRRFAERGDCDPESRTALASLAAGA